MKIISANSTHYSKIIDFFRSKETEFYTFKPKDQKGFIVILRNMHYSTDVGNIKRELSELGHEVMHVRNILHSRTKNQLSLFSFELKTNMNNRDIFSITDLLHCKLVLRKRNPLITSMHQLPKVWTHQKLLQ